MVEFCTRDLLDDAIKACSDFVNAAEAWHSTQYFCMMPWASAKLVFPPGLGLGLGPGTGPGKGAGASCGAGAPHAVSRKRKSIACLIIAPRP